MPYFSIFFQFALNKMWFVSLMQELVLFPTATMIHPDFPFFRSKAFCLQEGIRKTKRLLLFFNY